MDSMELEALVPAEEFVFNTKYVSETKKTTKTAAADLTHVSEIVFFRVFAILDRTAAYRSSGADTVCILDKMSNLFSI